MKKRLLACLLTAAMLVGMLPLSASPELLPYSPEFLRQQQLCDEDRTLLRHLDNGRGASRP